MKGTKAARAETHPGMEEQLVAPCGMNCNICAGYLAYKHDVKDRGIRMMYCIGCRPRDKACASLKRDCKQLRTGQVEYCYECDDFPCDRLSALDRRYRENFRMSEIANLECIRDHGIDKFLRAEEEKWKCPKCGGTRSCHNGLCFECDLEELKRRKKKYRW